MGEPERPPIAGVVLAGGQSRRMGGRDKALIDLAGKPLIAHAIERLKPQVNRIALSANGDTDRFAFTGLPVRADTMPGHAGPLAGVLSAMRWAGEAIPAAEYLATAAADTPFFPVDFVDRCRHEAANHEMVLCRSGDHRHPVFALWRIGLADALEGFLATGETGKVMAFVSGFTHAEVTFPITHGEHGPHDPFFNINTPQDLALAHRLMGAAA